MQAELRNANKVVGLKQLRKALRENTVLRAFVAEDAESRITGPVIEACREAGVPVEQVPTMAQLGAACGIEVGAAVAGILKADG